MPLQDRCHGPWSEETELDATSAVTQCNFSAHQSVLILCANLSRNGELSTSTHSESGWLPERTILRPITEAWSGTNHRLPVPPRRRWLVGTKVTPSDTITSSFTNCQAVLPRRGQKLTPGAQCWQPAITIFDLNSKMFEVGFVSREAAMDLSLIAVNSLMRKSIKRTRREERFLLSFFYFNDNRRYNVEGIRLSCGHWACSPQKEAG